VIRLGGFVLVVVRPVGMPRHFDMPYRIERGLMAVADLERTIDRIVDRTRARVRFELDIELVGTIEPRDEL